LINSNITITITITITIITFSKIQAIQDIE